MNQTIHEKLSGAMKEYLMDFKLKILKECLGERIVEEMVPGLVDIVFDVMLFEEVMHSMPYEMFKKTMRGEE